MQKNKRLIFFTCLLLGVFVVTLVQCAISSSYYTNTKANSFVVFSGQSKVFFSSQSFHTAGSSSDEAAFLAIEENLEENEEDSEKGHFPFITFAGLSPAHYFKKTYNHFLIPQPFVDLAFSIPLHIKNCIYLI